jgi:tetratricopeptide (TPR) repeat protein
MPLNDFFQNQFAMLKYFMEMPGEVVRCVRVDPDLKEMFLKAMAKMEDEPDFSHMIIPCDTAFESPAQFFSGLQARLTEEYEKHAAALKEEGIVLEVPDDKHSHLNPGLKFCVTASKLSDSFPDSVGSLIFLLDPEEVKDKESYVEAIEFLTQNTHSVWVKYLILDQRLEPVLEGLEERNDKAGMQVFYVSPEEIEALIRADMENPFRLTPVERRQYIGLLAGFSFGRKDYDEAARLQLKWIGESEKNGTPQETANAYYTLGNTQLAQEDFLAAEDAYCKSIELCLDHEVNSLAPLVVTNLGVALHRQQRVEEAIQCFNTARNAFKAQNQLPGEAHALDCLASMYYAEERHEEAETAWLEALALYDGITSKAFSDVRRAGRQDLQGKLERLYGDTGQHNKAEDLKRTSGGA